ncbi:HAD hydrolase-like protein [Ruminiclostridium josui]|uniref:HAD hydrolase-like protein n=1 Tax=Ruminiclostridium josui TaxID=1499 RepID=UPI0004664FEF|nr:HAD hydrolase-like protein [Ruminiclostridium josui]
MNTFQKPQTVLIDFDGVISKNSVLLLFNCLHGFINRYTPFPREALLEFFKSTVSFPVKSSMELILTSLGIEDKIMELYREVSQMQDYGGTGIKIEENFYSFIDFCKKNSISYRIFSSASKNVKRFSELLERVDNSCICNLKGRSKARYATFSETSQELNIDLKKCLYIDDSPSALMTGKLHGITTVMMLNDIFTLKDYGIFNEFIDYKVNSFKEVEAIIENIM